MIKDKLLFNELTYCDIVNQFQMHQVSDCKLVNQEAANQDPYESAYLVTP